MHTRIACVFSLGFLLLAAGHARADALDDIQQRGALRWGGDKSGGGPYIFGAADGRLTGFEVELADYLARGLGVRSEFVQWDWDMLTKLLDRGTIDIVLNGYEWSAEREQLWASTIPYYIYKLQLLVRSDDESIQSWDDLRAGAGRRKRVGVLQASAAHRYVETRFGDSVERNAYPDVTSVMGLVQDGVLDATVQDVPAAAHYREEFPNLRPAGEPEEPGYYVILLRRGDDRLRDRINELLLRGIEDGTLKRIYEKYGIWSKDQTRLPELAADWPPQIPPPLARWANMSRYLTALVWSAWMTIKLSVVSMPLAMLLGLLVALGRLYGPWWVGRPLEAYVEFLRGTPLVLQLLVIYFVTPRILGVGLPEFWAGVLGLAINYSAYEAENYRAGLLAIPRGQMEAALALGMSTRTALRRVIVPQAVRIVIPPVTNDFIALFKDTSVCLMIGVAELAGTYRLLSNTYPRLTLEFGLMTALLYLMMSYPLSLVARRMESRYKRVIV